MEYDDKRELHEGLCGEYIADLEQQYGQASMPGPVIPSQVTHGTVFSWNEGRHLLGIEHLLAQGFPTVPAAKSKYSLPWQAMIDNKQISKGELIHLAGNAMNLCVLHAWTLYWMSSIQKYDDTHLMFSPLALFNGESDDEDPMTPMDSDAFRGSQVVATMIDATSVVKRDSNSLPVDGMHASARAGA